MLLNIMILRNIDDINIKYKKIMENQKVHSH